MPGVAPLTSDRRGSRCRLNSPSLSPVPSLRSGPPQPMRWRTRGARCSVDRRGVAQFGDLLPGARSASEGVKAPRAGESYSLLRGWMRCRPWARQPPRGRAEDGLAGLEDGGPPEAQVERGMEEPYPAAPVLRNRRRSLSVYLLRGPRRTSCAAHPESWNAGRQPRRRDKPGRSGHAPDDTLVRCGSRAPLDARR